MTPQTAAREEGAGVKEEEVRGSAKGPTAGIGEPILIHIWVRSVEPVAGDTGLHEAPSVRFEGWLDLLARLSDLVASADAVRRKSGGRSSGRPARRKGGRR